MISLTGVHPRSWPPIMSDPELAAQVEALARQTVGEGAPAHLLQLARKEADARIELD